MHGLPAKIAVMGGEQAAKTMLQIEVSGLRAKGKETNRQKKKNCLMRSRKI